MPKTDRKLKRLHEEVGEAIGKNRDFKVQKMPVKIISRFKKHISKVHDHRAQWDIEYPIESIILMVFIAVLAGADTWVDIEEFCEYRAGWLAEFIDLPNGCTPCNDTFSRVFHALDTEEFHEMAVAFITDNLSDIKRGLGIASPEKRHLAIDGKQERGTGRLAGTDRETKDQQTLHVFDSVNGVCIISRRIHEKTNEIPEAQDILMGMETLKDVIISGDALHTQTRHAGLIIGKKGDYVLGLKGNQSQLKEEAELLFTKDFMAKLKGSEETYFFTAEKAHNQIEKREYYMALNADQLPSAGKRAGLKAILCVVKTMENLVTHEISTETRYYITSLTDIEMAATIVRAHWGVEIMHFYQDTVFHQDDNQTADPEAGQNLATIKKMCLPLIKIFAVLRDTSVALARKALGWAPEELIPELLSFYDEETLPVVLNSPFKEKKPRSRIKVAAYNKMKEQQG